MRKLLLLNLSACAGHSACQPAADSAVELAAAPDTAAEQEGAVVLSGGSLAGGEVADVRLEDGVIAAVGSVSLEGAVGVDVAGKWLAPAFVDSHVHLAYQPDAEGMLDGGVVAAVDLAAPVDFLTAELDPLTVIAAGPMITAPGGYPTQSWGSGGYGLECEDDAAAAAVDSLADMGAGVIKVPLTSGPTLSEAALAAVVETAHSRGLKVAVHALSDDEAALAAAVGVDVLAHTPTAALSESTIAAWADGAVISTLAAFGGGSTTVANLVALREAGATVLYGTDFGNLRTAGIVEEELALLAEAGLSGAEILAAGTSAPAQWWGLSGLGALVVGGEGSVLVLGSDPMVDAAALAAPEQVWVRGVRR